MIYIYLITFKITYQYKIFHSHKSTQQSPSHVRVCPLRTTILLPSKGKHILRSKGSIATVWSQIVLRSQNHGQANPQRHRQECCTLCSIQLGEIYYDSQLCYHRSFQPPGAAHQPLMRGLQPQKFSKSSVQSL